MPSPITSSEARLVPLSQRPTTTSSALTPSAISNLTMPPPQRIEPPPLLANRSQLMPQPQASPCLITPLRPHSITNVTRYDLYHRPLRPSATAAARKKTPPTELDITSPGVLSHTRKLSDATPQLADRILQETLQLHKKSLQRLIGKTHYSESDKTTIKQAMRHLLVRENAARPLAIEAMITDSTTLSDIDKQALQMRIRSSGPWLKPDIAARRLYPLSELSNALSHDLIEMLVQCGATEGILHHFLHDKNIADTVIRMNLLAVPNASIPANTAITAKLSHIKKIVQKFSNQLADIVQYLAPELNFPERATLENLADNRPANDPAEHHDYLTSLDHFRNRAAEGILLEEVVRNRVIRLLEINYLRCSALVELFKEASTYHSVFMERSIIHQEQRDLSPDNHNLTKLSNLLKKDYKIRSFFLMRQMEVASFVFSDTLQPPAMNLEGLPYGYRGLPFRTLNDWINSPEISNQRLEYIGLYCNTRLTEITQTGKLDLSWMASLSDATLERFFLSRQDLTQTRVTWHRFVLANALKQIGHIIIGSHYDHPHLPELLAWVRKQVKYPASDNALAYWLFENTRVGLSLPLIAANIKRAQFPASDFVYPFAQVLYDVRRFIRGAIIPSGIREIDQAEQIRSQFNRLVRKEKILAFIAQRFGIRIIQEDALEDFQQFYDNAGQAYPHPPGDRAEAIVVRPGAMIPIAADGAQASSHVEYADNHSLLQALLRYLNKRGEVWLNDKLFDEQVCRLEGEIYQQTAQR